MSDDPDLYVPPRAKLLDERPPKGFRASGLRAGYFEAAAACAALVLVADMLHVVQGFIIEPLQVEGADWSELYWAVPEALLNVFVLLALRKLLNHRLDHHRSNWIINAMIVLSVASIVPAVFLSGAPVLTGWPWLTLYALVFVSGLLGVWMGINLVRMQRSFSYSRLFAWTTLASSALMVTLILLLPGIVIGWVSLFALGLMFIAAGQELNPVIAPIRAEMAQDPVHTVRSANAGNTGCISKRAKCAVCAGDKPDQARSVG